MVYQETTRAQQADQLSMNKAGSTTEQSQDFTSDVHLDHYINTSLTDEQILSGDPNLITQERILQVSATHTAEEITNKVNSDKRPHALTPTLVYHRIHTACQSVANKNNTSFRMVKLALNNARVESGVKARINATLGRAAAPADTSPTSGVAGKKGNIKDSDTSLTDVDESTAPSYLGDFFSTESTLRAANPLFKRIAKGGSKLPENEDLIRLAARHTVKEMVEMVQNADPMSDITNTKISARIMDALSLVATARTLPRDAVKREFDNAKQENGVVARHYEKISTKRKETTRVRKAAAKANLSMKSAGPGQRGRIKKALSISVEPEGEEEDDLDLLQWTAGVRQNATPPSDLISEDDTPMIDSDDETVAWIDSPTYAKYKPILGTPISEVCSEDEMQNEITKANLEREDAAKSLLRLHWYGEPDLTDEGAAMILLNLRAEAQDIQMGMPSDLND